MWKGSFAVMKPHIIVTWFYSFPQFYRTFELLSAHCFGHSSRLFFRENALINSLYSTCSAPNGRQKTLAKLVEHLAAKSSAISLRSWLRLKATQNREWIVNSRLPGGQKHNSKFMQNLLWVCGMCNSYLFCHNHFISGPNQNQLMLAGKSNFLQETVSQLRTIHRSQNKTLDSTRVRWLNIKFGQTK